MAKSYHNFGPCVPQLCVATGGTLAAVGVSEDGGRVTIEHKERPLHSDISGPEAEAEIQAMGEVAFIDFTLVSWDDTLLAPIVAAASGGTTEGQTATAGIGALLGTADKFVQIYLPSSTDNPWYFKYGKLVGNEHSPVGTQFGKRKLRFKAIRFVAGSAVSMSTTALYLRTAPP